MPTAKSKKQKSEPVRARREDDDDDAEVVPGDEAHADPVVEEPEPEVDDDDDEGGGEGDGGDEPVAGKTDEERAANQRKRRRAVARRRGYRLLATKGGYSSAVASADAARDCIQNIVSLKETTRACKWAPAIADKSAYEHFGEFQERTMLAHQPLAKGPAAVFRASGEAFLRKLVNESVQRTFDAGKTRVSVPVVMSALRPLVPVLKYSFAAPYGLVDHAQRTRTGPEGRETPALALLESDEALVDKMKRTVPKQVELVKRLQKEEALRKAASVKKHQEKMVAASGKAVEPAIGKKKKKPAAAVAGRADALAGQA